MQISSNYHNNYNSQTFKGLDYSRVYGNGLELVKKELPQLEELGTKYDIKLSSINDVLFDEEYIDVKVKHLYLGKKPTLFEKIFNTKGWADCKVGCESITEAVKKAIQTLQ